MKQVLITEITPTSIVFKADGVTGEMPVQAGWDLTPGEIIFLNEDNTIASKLTVEQIAAINKLSDVSANSEQKPKATAGAGRGSIIGDKFAKPARF